jgi:peptidoglycan/xylan/chitin deacetylase (PgdA/CDA1 family)
VVVAARVLWENLDVRQLAPGLPSTVEPLPDPVTPASAAVPEGSFSVVLLNSPQNRSYFPDSTYYDGALNHWRRLVQEVGGQVMEVASPEELQSLDPQELLVMPEAPCLSRAEVGAIRTHLAEGGGMVSNWALGVRDEECEWRGWETLVALTGAGEVREVEVREALYLTVPGETPLSPGMDPGTRIELRPDPSLALTLEGPRVYWSDWALNPAPDESGGGADVAASTTKPEAGGRSTWFGFRLSQAATSQDSVRLERLVKNGILWASGVPRAYPSTWPHGRRAAMILAQDVESESRNALAMAELLRELSLPGSFFPVSQLVLEDDELAGALAGAGEVGTQTSDNRPVAGLSRRDQLLRLRRSWTDIRGWTGVGPVGLRPPEETLDTNTLEAWREVGGRYILATNEARSASPEVYLVGGGTVILIPRLMKDDFNVFVQDGAFRGERLTEAFLAGAKKIRAIGGLAVVSTHTQILGSGGRLDAFRTLADTVRAEGDWWISEAGSVAQWWSQKAAIRVAFLPTEAEASESQEVTSPDSLPSAAEPILISVEGPEEEAVTGLWIDIVLPKGGEELSPLVNGVPVPFSRTSWGIRVPVGDLPAGGESLISLTVLPEVEPETPG